MGAIAALFDRDIFISLPFFLLLSSVHLFLSLPFSTLVVLPFYPPSTT